MTTPQSTTQSDSSGRPATESEPVRWLAVYAIAERPGGRKHWLRIGTAFINRDQSMNVRLDAMPVNGLLHIRQAVPGASPPTEPGSNPFGIESDE